MLMEMYCYYYDYYYYYYYFLCFIKHELCGRSERQGAIKTNVLQWERVDKPQSKSGLNTINCTRLFTKHVFICN
jgi:hypothetical protein